MENREYLAAAAAAVERQLADNPDIGVPLDPDVADHMGAFTEKAVVLADLMDDALLTINDQGEAFYEE